jgi:hypothetical protein
MVLVFISLYHAHDPQSREKYDCSDRENLKHQITSWKYGVHGAPPLVENQKGQSRLKFSVELGNKPG